MGPTVHDAVREGHQTMRNMEDYNNASAMAAPGTHQLSAGLEMIALHEETVQTSICTGTILCCMCVCVCVVKNIRPNEKHTKMIFSTTNERALSVF